jgi:transposase
LVTALLLDRDQAVVHLPGIAVNRAAAAYRGEGKTDAKDAAIIADQTRMRHDLRVLRVRDTTVVELRMLTAHRADLAADRVRTISRLRSRLLGIFPSLERELDFTNQGPLVLIGMVQTPRSVLEMGATELERRLREHGVRGPAKLAAAAVRAAEAQQARLPGEAMAAQLIARLANTVVDLDRQLAEVNTLIVDRFAATATPR